MANAQKYRVLVVDDDKRGIDTIAGVLWGDVDVVTATSGDGALRCLALDQFHVVCTDFKMPGMNGLELLHEVSRLPYPIGCLLITAADERFPSEEGNAFSVLLKPFNPERLIGLVLELARTTESKRAVVGGHGI
jgi:CheY-like chemotaxis protein